MICVTLQCEGKVEALRKLLINSIQPKCDGDNGEMDFKCVLHWFTTLFHYSELKAREAAVTLFPLIIAVCWVTQRLEIFTSLHFTSHHAWNDVAAALTSWMQTCPSCPRWHTGGSCHHQHVALSCLATTWRSKVAADWHLITATHSGFTIGSLQEFEKNLALAPSPRFFHYLSDFIALIPFVR